ncbi:uncharacterized protein CELE_C47E8.1 [Caenorhabditis elegans]|uniref:Transmembrane protein n=1 Tax=Caenorhabditis elegans TaxID=6239 RepID=Q18686_CAEEL|nr:Transmembrane protein [Caenorhabditis elegans]CAA99791.2 Transmembrane protein [Caenorhabditis elegans]|eukprot:NP_506623.2 Uncharacterized protein CELE_C47E8.1 [Caenorhabditis elegans]
MESSPTSSTDFAFGAKKTDSADTFQGFSDKYNFTASVLCMLTFGFGAILLSTAPMFITGLISTVWMIACFRWLNLHGPKMTRNEVIFFEASNLLELDPPVFRFGMTANVDDCLTPGDGEQREPPQPQTLWDALFSDEKKIQMDKFYQKHYGGVHAHATKMFMEYEMEKAKEDSKGGMATTSPKYPK